MVKGIEHVAIFSKDTTALKDWYAQQFGFKTVYDSGKGTYFLMAPDGAMIEFVKAVEDGGVFGEKVSGIRHLALAVENFEEAVEKMKAANVEVVAEPVVTPAGVKTFFFRDPDGNVLHFISRPQPLA